MLMGFASSLAAAVGEGGGFCGCSVLWFGGHERRPGERRERERESVDRPSVYTTGLFFRLPTSPTPETIHNNNYYSRTT